VVEEYGKKPKRPSRKESWRLIFSIQKEIKNQEGTGSVGGLLPAQETDPVFFGRRITKRVLLRKD